MAKQKSKKSNFKSKWLLVAGAFVVLFVVLFSAYINYLKTPTPVSSQIPGWKTYNGDSFSFKYPQTWQIHKESSNIGIGPDLSLMYIYPINYDPNKYVANNYLNSKYVVRSTNKTLRNPNYSVTEYFIQYQENAPVSGPTEITLIAMKDSNNRGVVLDSYGTADKTFYQIYSTFKLMK